MAQLSLLKQHRFLPFFITQALGAFNDNLYKNFLLLSIVFSSLYNQTQSAIFVNIAAAVFILPFFLLSPIGGQLADKYEKSKLIQRLKIIEILVMTAGAIAIYLQSLPALMVILFVMGAQSAFFGPVKFALMPQHLSPKTLLAGNALVEMGTFLAILGGTLAAGYIFTSDYRFTITAVIVVFIAIIGFISSLYIPKAAPNNPKLSINWNPFTQIVHTVRITKKNRTVYLSILAISWFWFVAATYLTQLPNLAKVLINDNPQYVTLLLTLFSIGIALGAWLCEKLSGDQVELGIIPIGAFGISFFGIDLYIASQHIITHQHITIIEFILTNKRILVDLMLLSISGSLFVVPLNALIQQRSEQKNRAQIIAGNNILNALFMVLSALFSIIMLTVFNATISELLLTVAIINALVAIYVFSQVQEFVLRFVVWLITRVLYRIKSTGLENIPKTGPAILICNHVSFVDALLIGAASRRSVRFVMDKNIANLPLAKYLFKWAKTIPICAQKVSPQIYRAAFNQVEAELIAGNIVCIFPEGKITRTGELNDFKRGIEVIIKRTPVVVVPMGLKGVWGSIFSRQRKFSIITAIKRFRSELEVLAAPPILPEDVSASKLQSIVQQLIR
ncbi:acyl-phosphate glycerol 3-phosphate acyltransferase [Photobacterium kishitanii]|uniref:MFS transporter n=1 Tax=Photobacterium kishitanii TaxID=318456 RepID=A0AAX0YXK1_9GAMM|nr:MFS transporter [Photobacterium kishitanii]KJG09711.1 acyl-phosphate glycerol 3-phosphate acyltransferase [Photobacterium kishitanii]KJG57940.1 acyl-phosphate glycerol 3-phosphate acyltransferase [Photobacterium kishitanii]KJG61516.1 acyl-phosphate glycerol 3-phosphate acyltransferase [Photobacterium kishitanii]KJG66354.1 acyl-phosphate glycerol 3-phosphate acyltransferase [Photobacterium kishitanii]PSV07785.1 MFS transporter [Photobacterium kishitanii]